MKTDKLGKADTSGYIAGLFIVACVYLLIFFDYKKQLSYLMLVAAALPVVYLLLFNKSLLLQLTVLLVPLSIKITTPFFGSAFTAPSELILTAVVVFTIPIIFFTKRVDRKLLLHPLTILFVIDTGWMIVASMNSEMPDVSFKRVIMRIIFLTGFYFIFAHLFENRKLLSRPHLLYAIGLIPPIFYIWRAHAHYNFDSRAAFEISAPFYPDHTVYGASIAFVIPFIVIMLFNSAEFLKKPYQKRLLIVVAIVLFVAEFFAYSRAAIISLAAVVVLYAAIKLFKVQLWHLVTLMMIMGALTFAYSGQLMEWARKNDAVSNDGDLSNHYKSVTNITRDASNLERINRWVCAYRMFEDRPLTGYGPGTYQFVYAQFQTKETTTYISTRFGDRGNAHSEYLTYLSETGIFGFISFICITFYSIYLGLSLYYKRSDRYIKSLILAATFGLVTFFFHGLFNAFIDQDKMAALVFPALAILVAIDVYHKEEPVSAANDAQ